jgi:hypothetical protein
MKSVRYMLILIGLGVNCHANANKEFNGLLVWDAIVAPDDTSYEPIYIGALSRAYSGLRNSGYERVTVAVSYALRPCWQQETDFHKASNEWNINGSADKAIPSSGSVLVSEGGSASGGGHMHWVTRCAMQEGQYCGFAKVALKCRSSDPI